LKIVQKVRLIGCGAYSESDDWHRTRKKIYRAIRGVDWPVGSGTFTIYPESGKKRGKGNGVKPIKDGLIEELRQQGWKIEGKAKNALGAALGDFDAVLATPYGPVVLEWETGNISSSHRSLNKMAMLLMQGVIAAGILVVPSRKLYRFLTDRIGNIAELEPYFPLWSSVPCKQGILEIAVIEHDAESVKVPRIPKGTDGRAKG
jgi:hypothetical protein